MTYKKSDNATDSETLESCPQRKNTLMMMHRKRKKNNHLMLNRPIIYPAVIWKAVQEKHNEGYSFADYTANEKWWLCPVCKEYGQGGFWLKEGVKLWEYWCWTFEQSLSSKRHKTAKLTQQDTKRLLTIKGSVHDQMVQGGRVHKLKHKKKNSRIRKILLVT